MRSTILSMVICGLFCAVVIATANGATYLSNGECDNGCGCNTSCGGGWIWWPFKGPASRNGGCEEDCGYPYRYSGSRSCNPCGDSCRPMTCHDKTYCGPLTPLFALFMRDSWSNCGCGERYWGDFYGDPPDYCDPCDRCGNYTGRGNGCDNGNGRCGNNGGVREIVEPAAPMEGRVISQGDRISRKVPTPATKNAKTVKH
jgi:hypothetical protein